MNKKLISLLCAALFVTACNKDTASHAAHDGHGAAQAEAAGHGHDHGPAGEKRTHFTDRTELFVEFPRLVVGEKSAFAAHLTTLSNFQALEAGKVTVILSGGNLPEEQFSIDGPSQAGIFRPVATPKQAGQRDLVIEVATKDFSVRHSLGQVTVFNDRKTADASASEEDEGGIGFTKEQQWKVDFATQEVVKRPLRAAITASGTLGARPDGEALITATAAGQIKPAGSFPVLGQAVKKGDVLAYLAPRLGGDTDMASLQADARRAKVELDLATRERTRMESLYKDEAVPEKRLLAARGAEESARAGFEATQSRLGQYGGSAGGVPLRAPVSGTLVDIRVSPGGFAQEGALLFHIADRRVLWLQLRVPEVDAVRLKAPVGASFQVDGVDERFEITQGRNGQLIAVGGAVDASTRTVPVVYEFQHPDERLRIGMAVKGQVLLEAAKEAVAVPAAAILDESGIPTVFVMKHGEAFERRAIRTGARDGDWVEVVDGLQPGERVVSRGAYLVKLAATKTGEIGHGHAH
ncbi:efflux RND transporter periplasmic adaptor subunit [Dokdonella sp.]|jgi:cobalt-zinc-cadmium efflux system membrane fusion protein|uniref:efflux RND transporter periplasmic adaptor subunit n=1 Tax=Dokdonella sp. TaxID=2291710 RepID=UPI002DD684A4|nr:efflux RND transporter periplasmic adaptor subunit [Dokdonella sp.]